MTPARLESRSPQPPHSILLHRVLHDHDAVYPKRQQCVETFAYARRSTGSTRVLSVHYHRPSTQRRRPFGPLRPEAHPATFQLELPGTVRSQTRCRTQAQAKHRSSASASVQLILSLGGFNHANERWGGQWTCTYKSSCVEIARVAWIPDLEALRKARRRPLLDPAARSSADAFPL